MLPHDADGGGAFEWGVGSTSIAEDPGIPLLPQLLDAPSCVFQTGDSKQRFRLKPRCPF